MTRDPAAAPSGDIVHPSAIPFILDPSRLFRGHLVRRQPGRPWRWASALYWLRMFAITGGYHRYFSHRAYSTGRVFQFVLGFLAQTTGQKSVLWWAAKHRNHHRHSDTAQDLHSPRLGGFFHSHVGWIFDRRNDVDRPGAGRGSGALSGAALAAQVRGRCRRSLLALLCFAVAGWSGLVVGFCWSTVLRLSRDLLHQLAGPCARQPPLRDRRRLRNNPILALVTMGEGWHNNHHAFQSSARQGFRWWEIDAHLLRPEARWLLSAWSGT